jgi:hypothetical protein
VSWLSDLLHGRDEFRSFDDDLSILIARWTDYSRKGRNTMTLKEVGNALLDKAEKILDGKEV